MSSVGIVELLRELQIAEERQLRELRPDLLREGAVRRRGSAPCTATSIGVGEPKLITWLTMSPASNETCTSGSSLAKAGAQPLAQRLRRAALPGLSAT